MSNPGIGLCLNVCRAYARLRLELDEELGLFHGIDLDDFVLLHALASAKDDSTSLKHLAAELGVSHSAMLRRLRPLEKIGLVASHGDVRDRAIALRPAGGSLMSAAKDTVDAVCGKLFAAEDASRLNEALLESEWLRTRDAGVGQQG